MSNLSVFNFNQNEIRTIIKEDGEIWFVASDVAKVLEYSETSAMTRHLDNEERGLSIVQTLGGSQEVITINESGLYSATLKSRKPEAKSFKKWITSVVLPSIRKNGGYIAGQENDDPELIIAKALQVANNVIIRKTQELQQALTERDHAIETKAHISDKKTATAMATASAKSRQAEALKEQLGESKNYASIKAVEIKTGGKYGWHKLKKWCEAKGKKIKDIADPNFGTVKIYPREAWEAVYGVKLNSIFQA
ncbi:Phage antirepressor protein [Acinetobacter guillouiae MSP4-18]|uniref:BRO-N domain-containing protein n=1 Tax=Acinetobacter guillouiae TaxID=106649 RepID=UPI0002CEDF4E|nr:BRO family protein [Acinetobacter guillouiae]ENU56738.1 hypothetical protein F981_04245 [Acinetobacter guillouiae CIP 63.46]EPH34289.1 Phage antirepressor protein [Acinetobacter guillouiae MSP4-18]KAB0623677.1 phage antirepressor protein [Acinetobacter guillouiae]